MVWRMVVCGRGKPCWVFQIEVAWAFAHVASGDRSFYAGNTGTGPFELRYWREHRLCGALRQRRLGTLGSLEGVAAAEVEEEEEAEEKPVKEKE